MQADVSAGSEARRGGHRGFTLIELLMVIVLIGLLIGILMPVLSKTKRKAKEKQAEATMRALTLAMRTFHFEKRHWPVPEADRPLSGVVEDKVYAENNHEILSEMTNCRPPFFDPGQHLRDGTTGSLVDPWGAYYSIKVDLDYDGTCQGEAAPNGVIVTSPNL